MDKLAFHQGCLQQTLKRYSSTSRPEDDETTRVIKNLEHGHFALMSIGWKGNKRVFGTILHFDIRERKIWVQRDGTDVGVADELVELGVPKEDIVLGFQMPFKRKFSGFATG